MITENEKIILFQATSILSDICDIYVTYCCKGCPLANICSHHTINIVDLLDESLDKIEVK